MNLVYALVALNVSTLAALLYIVHVSSQERRILWASALAAGEHADAARVAGKRTPAEDRKAVEDQIALGKALKEDGGVFSAQNPFASRKPLGI